MRKALGEMQTLRADCNKAEPFFCPAADPLPGGAGRLKFNQLIGDGHYLSLQFGEDRCTQFRVIVVTDPQTHKHTDRTDNNTLRR